MIHDTGIMDVLIDGKPEVRVFEVNADAPLCNRYIKRIQTRYRPQLKPNESYHYEPGSDIPIITRHQS